MKAPTPILLSGKSHGWSSLVGCSPWGHWESDTTERLHFYFSLSCIGEGNGNPLQYTCLENPRDGGAWWAAVYGVAQSRTRLTWLSSSIWPTVGWIHRSGTMDMEEPQIWSVNYTLRHKSVPPPQAPCCSRVNCISTVSKPMDFLHSTGIPHED